VNVFMQRGFPAMVLRYITADMPPHGIARLPEVMTDLVLIEAWPHPDGGLHRLRQVNLAGGNDQLPQRECFDHIVTIEDPIEFLHTNKRSLVNQREVGIDTKSYARALRGVVRAAPDVILIGEIRDRESMEAAINLAGTGHLVLATLHANNCAESLDRIINMFPREQHNQIFLDMSQYLRAILAQRLVMGRDGKRVAAVEVMIQYPAHPGAGQERRCHGIKEAITSSGERGIQSFDVSLRDLFKSGRIELEEALSNADSRANLEAKINFG